MVTIGKGTNLNSEKSRRLSDKLRTAKRAGARLDDFDELMALLKGGEGRCNEIPGGVPSGAYPSIVISSIRSPQVNFYRTAAWCLTKLIEQLKDRIDSSHKTESIKIIVDEISTPVASQLNEIAQLASKLESKLEIDLIINNQFEAMHIEKFY